MDDDLKQLHAAPKTIYLQVDPEGIGPSELDTLDGATWCAEQINDNDVCYVRSDRIEQLEAALRGMMDTYNDLCDESEPNYRSFKFRQEKWEAANAALGKGNP